MRFSLGFGRLTNPKGGSPMDALFLLLIAILTGLSLMLIAGCDVLLGEHR